MRWDNETLGNIAKVISGYAFKSDSFRTDKGVPIIKIKNIQREYVEIDGEYYVDNTFLSLDSKYHCTKDDILISLTGSHITLPNSVVGRVAKYHYDFTSLLNQRGGKIVVTNPEKLENNYLYYYLCQNEIRIKLAQFGRGGANQCNISPSNVESILITFPPLPTQKRIASILSTYDDLIENNLKRIKLLEETSQNIYKEWFVNFRFPNYENTPFNEEIGLPVGWEVKNINLLFNIKYGKNLPTTLIKSSGKYHVYGASGVMGYYEEKNVSERVALITSRGNGSGEIHRTFQEETFVTNNSFVVLPKENYNYIPFFFITECLKKLNLKSYCSGSAQPQLTNASMNNLEMSLPSKNLIAEFKLKVYPIYELIDKLYIKNQKLKEARDILLPRLMNKTIEV